MKELVSVIIPIFNPVLTSFEQKILDHCLLALHKYAFIFVVSEKAQLAGLKERYQHVDFISFNEKYFESRRSFANLLLMEGFYERFSWSEFLLVHELNSWIVKDELHYWCKQGYDFLKADVEIELGLFANLARFRGLSEEQKKSIDSNFDGNGLFLCQIERFVKTLKSKKKEAYAYRHHPDFKNPDSLFWELEPNRFVPGLRRPTKIVQKRFSKNINDQSLITSANREALSFGLTGINEENIQNLPFFG